ncbi:hypothetical protein BH10PSE13_BH10PSE13_06460 [soil metagenome]
MATQPVESRSERVVVLMTATEKRDVVDKARTLGLSIGEYMRLAAEFGAMTSSERAELEALTTELQAMNESLAESFARLEETSQREIDEDGLRVKVRAELEVMDIDWAGVADRLGLTRSSANQAH